MKPEVLSPDQDVERERRARLGTRALRAALRPVRLGVGIGYASVEKLNDLAHKANHASLHTLHLPEYLGRRSLGLLRRNKSAGTEDRPAPAFTPDVIYTAGATDNNTESLPTWFREYSEQYQIPEPDEMLAASLDGYEKHVQELTAAARLDELRHTTKEIHWNDKTLTMRSVTADDEQALRDLYNGLSVEDKHLRFCGTITDAGREAVKYSAITKPEVFTTFGMFDGETMVGECTYSATSHNGKKVGDFNYTVARDYRGKAADGTSIAVELFDHTAEMLAIDPRIDEVQTEYDSQNRKSGNLARKTMENSGRFTRTSIEHYDGYTYVTWHNAA